MKRATKKALAGLSKPTPQPPGTTSTTSANGKVQGEGDYEAARRHRESLQRFVKSGQVEKAARDAEPATPVEEEALFNAEREGEQHSKGEDPALKNSPRSQR